MKIRILNLLLWFVVAALLIVFPLACSGEDPPAGVDDKTVWINGAEVRLVDLMAVNAVTTAYLQDEEIRERAVRQAHYATSTPEVFLFDFNTATVETLLLLNREAGMCGIGPTYAGRIIDILPVIYLDDLTQVSGISPSTVVCLSAVETVQRFAP